MGRAGLAQGGTLILADPSLLPLGAEQPVCAEVVAVLLPAHLPGVLWGDRVQPWRGALTARPAPPPAGFASVDPAPEPAGNTRPTPRRGWAGPHLCPAQGLAGDVTPGNLAPRRQRGRPESQHWPQRPHSTFCTVWGGEPRLPIPGPGGAQGPGCGLNPKGGPPLSHLSNKHGLVL